MEYNKKKILVIKLASAGDVLRTTPLLSGIKKRYSDSHVTWLVGKSGKELLEGNKNIDRILVYNSKIKNELKTEDFDIVISLDKDIEAIQLATAIKANEKYGFGLDQDNRLVAFNKEAEYSVRLGLDDELKFFKNEKTYPELIFETVKLKFENNPYELVLDKGNIDFADSFFKRNGLHDADIVIGVNTGSGRVFANKNLGKERIVEVIEILNEKLTARVLLLGGPLEEEINDYIEEKTGQGVINSGCDNSVKDFAALIGKCSLIITADTLAMHIAIALRVPTVVLFGPTCPQEIELYGRGVKIVTPKECAPCYRNKCDKKPNCMDAIQIESILAAVKEVVSKRKSESVVNI
ncbi:MAG: glycosyltransferase family 9 protein [Candidatus Omnitrophota bacterium]